MSIIVNGREKSRRILHTADVHLGLPGDKECATLIAVTDTAIKTRADLVIIAGDLFDHTIVQKDLISFAVEQLRRVTGYVAILPGNHDCLAGQFACYKDEAWTSATNVKIFTAPLGETFIFADIGVSVWGKALTFYTDCTRPLSGMALPEDKTRWHIAAAHGHYYNGESAYPMNLAINDSEIADSGQDYIALGHLHCFRYLCEGRTTACYCDSPSLGTVNIIDLDEDMGIRVWRCSL